MGFKFLKALIEAQNTDPDTGETLRHAFPGYLFTAYGAQFAVYQNPADDRWYLMDIKTGMSLNAGNSKRKYAVEWLTLPHFQTYYRFTLTEQYSALAQAFENMPKAPVRINL